MPKIKLNKLLKAIKPIAIENYQDIIIEGIAYNSNKVQNNFLFIAIEGTQSDGHKYIPDAIKRGASALIVSKNDFPNKENCSLPIIYVDSSRCALADVSSEFYNNPSKDMIIIGITGTNGKTTSAHILHKLFSYAGYETAVLGTIGHYWNGEYHLATHTTPESLELQEMFDNMRSNGVREVIMEVSSHSLIMERVRNIKFDMALFTNLTQDHLDFHKNMEEYFIAKSLLFKNLTNKNIAIINWDETELNAGKRLAELTSAKVISYGLNKDAQITMKDYELKRNSINGTIQFPDGEQKIKLKVGGNFNLYNTLASFACAWGFGLDSKLIADALTDFNGVRGRFEQIDEGQDFLIIVDYAHTPDALQRLLEAVREITLGNVLLVFGCGGDRDKDKRSQMGHIANTFADYIIITSDNPRTEGPEAIIDDIIKGIDGTNWKKIINRRNAIESIIKLAKSNDSVIIAGKGHEDYQIIGTVKKHFDDAEEARKILREIKNRR